MSEKQYKLLKAVISGLLGGVIMFVVGSYLLPILHNNIHEIAINDPDRVAALVVGLISVLFILFLFCSMMIKFHSMDQKLISDMQKRGLEQLNNNIKFILKNGEKDK